MFDVCLVFDDEDNGCQLVGGEKSERLSKCWLKLWRWRCTWNAQTNTSYALGHLGNLDILWDLENVVVICNMNYIFFFCWESGWQKTSWISWKSGYFGTDRLFLFGCTELDLMRAMLAEDIAKSAEALFSFVCSMHVHPVWNSATGLNLFCFH